MFDAAPPVPTPLMQDPAFAAALRQLGQHPLTLPDGHILLSRSLLGMPVLMLPRATPPPDLRAQLAARNLHRRPLILSPETACPLPRALRLRGPVTRAVLDLSGTPATRRAALHGKWRNALTRAEARGLHLQHSALPADPAHPLLTREAAQARAQRYANWPPALTAAFAAAAPAQTRLFTATHKGTRLAEMLFLRHGAAATYHIGLTTPAGRAKDAHNLILWQAMNWLAKRGTTTLDLGVMQERTPGLNRFKRRTGAALIPTGGTWITWHPLARRRLA